MLDLMEYGARRIGAEALSLSIIGRFCNPPLLVEKGNPSLLRNTLNPFG